MPIHLHLRRLVEERLERQHLEWLRAAARELGDGASDLRYGQVLSLASRHVPRAPLAPSAADRAAARRLVEGLEIERWTLLEAARVVLVLSRPDLGEEVGECAVAEVFRYADEGELCALYRSLALLPGPQRFVRRAGEGCRSNMRSVFEAAALDTPFPFRHFDEPAWCQAAIKCLFVGAPLWRLSGLDARLSPELARMALDLCDERRSAGRPVPPELWLCLGEHGGKRALAALEHELAPENAARAGRIAAAYGLARAGQERALRARLEREEDAQVASALEGALARVPGQEAFRSLAPA